MPPYYVNKNAQSNGDHEVHVSTCPSLPAIDSCVYLGMYESCAPAVTKAKETYAQSNGCARCSPDCHTD